MFAYLSHLGRVSGLALLLSAITGCAAVSELAIEQSISDYAGTDCRFKNLLYGEPLCRRADAEQVAVRPVYCYQTMGISDCYAEPQPQDRPILWQPAGAAEDKAKPADTAPATTPETKTARPPAKKLSIQP